MSLRLLILLLLYSLCCAAELFAIEGRLSLPEGLSKVPALDNWIADSRVLFNYEEYVAFVRHDGSFTAHVGPGSYIVEVASAKLVFEPVRIDVTSKGKVRARKLQLLQPAAVSQLSYPPLRMRAKGLAKYFQVREPWRITDMLFSPMVLMMVLPLVVIMILPRLVDTNDPEVQREMRETLQMPKVEMPELSEVMTSWFGGGNKKPKKKLKN